jgi:hypothetical protein
MVDITMFGLVGTYGVLQDVFLAHQVSSSFVQYAGKFRFPSSEFGSFRCS